MMEMDPKARAAFVAALQAVPRLKTIAVRSLDDLRSIPRVPYPDDVIGYVVSSYTGTVVHVDSSVSHRHARLRYADGREETLTIRPPQSAPTLHDLRGMVRASERRAGRAFWARDNETYKRESAELGKRRRALEAAQSARVQWLRIDFPFVDRIDQERN